MKERNRYRDDDRRRDDDSKDRQYSSDKYRLCVKNFTTRGCRDGHDCKFFHPDLIVPHHIFLSNSISRQLIGAMQLFLATPVRSWRG